MRTILQAQINFRIKNGPTISGVTSSSYLSCRCRRKFTCKATGYSECSKSCGKGKQNVASN